MGWLGEWSVLDLISLIPEVECVIYVFKKLFLLEIAKIAYFI